MIADADMLCEACESVARMAGSVEKMLAQRVARRAGFVEPEPKLNMALLPSLSAVAAMSEDDAWSAVKAMRWPMSEPSCPKCGCTKVFAYRSRRLFKCSVCQHQFTALSGTPFAHHKKPHRALLMLLAYDGPTHKAGTQIRTAVMMRRRKAANRMDK